MDVSIFLKCANTPVDRLTFPISLSFIFYSLHEGTHMNKHNTDTQSLREQLVTREPRQCTKALDRHRSPGRCSSFLQTIMNFRSDELTYDQRVRTPRWRTRSFSRTSKSHSHHGFSRSSSENHL